MSPFKDVQLWCQLITRRVEAMVTETRHRRMQILFTFNRRCWYCSIMHLNKNECHWHDFKGRYFNNSSTKRQYPWWKDIYYEFMKFVKKFPLPLYKLVCVATDGDPAIVGRLNGFVSLCRKNDDIPDFVSFHCVIHQPALCEKFWT